MKLFIVNNRGEKVTLYPGALTRSELFKQLGGVMFTMESSDYKYSILDVKAESSKDTSIGWFLILFLFSLMLSKIIIGSGIVGLVGFCLAKWYYFIDKKRADIFNNSEL